MHQKDFDTWNAKKRKLHAIQERPMFTQGEVWWCSLGVNIGDEQDGKGQDFTRPVLVLKKFNRNIFVAVPLSTQLKDSQFYHRFQFHGREQSLLLSQIRLIDGKRLKDRMGKIPSHEIENIKEKLRKLVL